MNGVNPLVGSGSGRSAAAAGLKPGVSQSAAGRAADGRCYVL